MIDLNPSWVYAGGEGISDAAGNPVPERKGVGLAFDCPGCKAPDHARVYVPFDNPLDGGPQHGTQQGWHRTGEAFATLTLTPSILRRDGCGWHGHVTNGEVTTC